MGNGTNNAIAFNEDDVFILGNLAGLAVAAQRSQEVDGIVKFIQNERPLNAGGFILEAIMQRMKGNTSRAIDILRSSKTLSGRKNSLEATGLYCMLLFENGQLKAAKSMAQEILGQGSVIPSSLKESLSNLLASVDELEIE